MLTVEQAAQRANVSPPAIYKAIERKKLKAKRYGVQLLIKPAELQRWLDTPEDHRRGPKRKQT